METARKKFGLHVQRGFVGLEHNEVFLQEAYSAWLCDWGVCWGSGYDTPRNLTSFREYKKCANRATHRLREMKNKMFPKAQ